MRLRASPVAVAAVLVLLAVAAAPASAGTADAPEVTDPRGDVATEPALPAREPWGDAVDLEAFWVEAVGGDIVFHYVFPDLARLDEAAASDVVGRSFWSYTDFEVRQGDDAEAHSLYMDHNANPTYETGWRFHLRERPDDALVGAVDAAAGRIDVTVPLALLEPLGPGGSLGAFRVQAHTHLAYPQFTSDWAPDDGACACAFLLAAPAAASSEPAPASATKESPVPALAAVGALAAAAALQAARRRA